MQAVGVGEFDPVATVPPGGSDAELADERRLVGFALSGHDPRGLDPADLYSPKLREVLSAAQSVARDGKADVLAVARELGERWGGREEADVLVMDLAYEAIDQDYATVLGRVKDAARRRGAYFAHMHAAELAWRGERPSEEAAAELKALIDGEQREERVQSRAGLPDYPLDVWPEEWRYVIECQANRAQTDPSIPAAYTSAALGAVLGPAWTFWVGPAECRPIVWTIYVAPSAIASKSDAVEVTKGAVLALHGERVRQWKADHAAWKAQDKPDPADEPRFSPLHIQDATLEAMAVGLSASDGELGMLSDQDEISGWLGGMDAYRHGASKDRAAWLSLRNGGTLSQMRVSRDPVHVERTHVCLVGGIQPEKLMDHGLKDGDGLFSRFCWSFVPRRYDYGWGPAIPREAHEAALSLLRAGLQMGAPRLRVEPVVEQWIRGYREKTDRLANELYHDHGLKLVSTVVSRASLYASTALAVITGAEAAQLEAQGIRNKVLTVGRDHCERAQALADYYVAHGKHAVEGVVGGQERDGEERHYAEVRDVLARLGQVVKPGERRAELASTWAELLGLPKNQTGRRLKTVSKLEPGSWKVSSRRTGGGREWTVSR